LSGGQKQRLSIARAMLRKSRILFLDEATSALDAESEHLVQAALDRLIALGNCTILLVAHRLSTVMNADQICVLDGGVIRERGTHDQLIQLEDGIYAKLVQRQLARKQNIIEDEAVGAAVAGKTAKEAKEAQEKLKEKKSKLDDFDSLFDEEEEKRQTTAAAAVATATSSAASSRNRPASTTSGSNATARKRSAAAEE
jgi:ABC-type multidrug transport system ATPase subunit